MEQITRDTYALLNAHHIPLQALYVHVCRTDVRAFDQLKTRIQSHLDLPPIPDSTEIAEIRPQTEDALQSFLDSVAAKLL
jgi:hypothetical protein